MRSTARRSLRPRLAAAGLGLTLGLGALSVHAGPPEPEEQERIESLWLDAAGTSGRLHTRAVLLHGSDRDVHFGPAFCGRSHRLGAPTLAALQTALAQSQPIRVETEPFGQGDDARHCLRGVTFFAPLP